MIANRKVGLEMQWIKPAIHIRLSRSHDGIHGASTRYQVVTFWDSLLTFCSEPQQSLPSSRTFRGGIGYLTWPPEPEPRAKDSAAKCCGAVASVRKPLDQVCASISCSGTTGTIAGGCGKLELWTNPMPGLWPWMKYTESCEGVGLLGSACH